MKATDTAATRHLRGSRSFSRWRAYWVHALLWGCNERIPHTSLIFRDTVAKRKALRYILCTAALIVRPRKIITGRMFRLLSEARPKERQLHGRSAFQMGTPPNMR